MTTGTRRKPSEYDFVHQLFDEQLLPTSGTGRRSTYPRGGTVKHIDIHHMIIHDSTNGAALTACVNTWKTRPASAHYGIDNNYIAQFVYDDRMAWADANGTANREGISIEHANSATGDPSGWPISATTIANSVRLVAGLHVTHKLGRPTSSGFGASGTVRTHNSFYATACPGPYFKKIWADYIKRVQAEYDRITAKPGSPATTPPVTPPIVTPPVVPPIVVSPGDTLTKVSMLHWNVAGSDDVNGYGATNGTRGDDVGRYALKLGFDVFLTCESSQANLRAGINQILGKFHPYESHSKTIWYDDSKVKNIKSRKVYTASPFSYLNTTKYGMAFFGSRNGKKFSVLEIHTDYRAPAKQAKQVEAIFLKWRKDCDALGIKHVNQFVCGDFNWDGTKGDDPMHALDKYNFEEKGDAADLAAGTFLDTNRHLDGVLAHEQAIVGVRAESRSDGKQRLSDHKPISFTATLQ